MTNGSRFLNLFFSKHNFIGSFNIAFYNSKKQDLEDYKKRLEKKAPNK